MNPIYLPLWIFVICKLLVNRDEFVYLNHPILGFYGIANCFIDYISQFVIILMTTASLATLRILKTIWFLLNLLQKSLYFRKIIQIEFEPQNQSIENTLKRKTISILSSRWLDLQTMKQFYYWILRIYRLKIKINHLKNRPLPFRLAACFLLAALDSSSTSLRIASISSMPLTG